MAKYKTNSKWRKILCVVLVIVALIGVAAIFSFVAKNDTKGISSSAFSRGDLDASGKHVKSDTSIYTKDAFDCVGLRVEPDFEFNGTYDVYYYDNDDRLLERILGLSGVYDEDHYFANRARIVIHPDLSAEEDDTISYFGVFKYARMVDITVNKKQDNNYLSVNLYNETLVEKGKSFGTDVEVGSTISLIESPDINTVKGIEVLEEYKTFHVFLRRPVIQSGVHTIGVCLSSEDKVLSTKTYSMLDVAPGEWFRCTYEVPEFEDGMTFSLRIPADCECYIFACGGCSVCE